MKGTLGKGIRSLQTREYSSHGWRRKNTYVQQLLFGNTTIEKHTVWPDPHLGCLGPKDQRLGFPGNIGLDKALLPTEPPPTPDRLKADKEELENQAKFWKSLLGTHTNHQHQIDIVNQDDENDCRDSEEMESIGRKLMGINENLECIAQVCPDLLRRELAGLFTNVNMTEGPLTVITFCQRTNHDMTSWSPSVEEEREALTEKFIRAAKDVCDKLRQKAQIWADFIEPCSGRPYYSSFTNLTFFETDERYRHLGFRISDLGCCKVIAHHKWGTHAFVGTIFTSAPHDCEHLQQIVERCNRADAAVAVN